MTQIQNLAGIYFFTVNTRRDDRRDERDDNSHSDSRNWPTPKDSFNNRGPSRDARDTRDDRREIRDDRRDTRPYRDERREERYDGEEGNTRYNRYYFKCIYPCVSREDHGRGRGDWGSSTRISSSHSKDSWGARAARDTEPNPFDNMPPRDDKIDFDQVHYYVNMHCLPI